MWKNTLAAPYLLLFASLVGLGMTVRDVWEDHFIFSPSRVLGGGVHTAHGASSQELVQDIFAEGACDNISNIKRIGAELGVGFFDNAKDIIGLEKGIILSTGTISNAEGPNKYSDASGNFGGAGGDPDLNHLATGQVFDAVGIEFDFVPLDSFVTFRYVFASEEYCEFVGSIYNDVFGFFISGPGINGNFAGNAKNVALIPGTQDFVAINSVNHLTNSNYYLGNERNEDANKCNLSVHQPVALNEIEYDGFTQPLTAMLKLNPCETYHIRLVVGDVGDYYYDSAVFLEAGSFNIGSVVSVRSSTGPTGEHSMAEGCADGYFIFERADQSKMDLPVTVQYKIAESSTAIEGEDFLPLAGIATIPIGEPSVKVPIFSLNDTLMESREKILLELDIPCACYSDSAFLYIEESSTFKVELPDAYVCENSEQKLKPAITGGNPTFTYEWSTGSTDAEIWVNANGPSQYFVTVTDLCGHQAFDSTHLIITTPPEVKLSGNASMCEGDTAYLHLDFTGSPPWTFIYAINGESQEAIGPIFQNPYLFPVFKGGNYSLTYFEDAACEGSVLGSATVETTHIYVSANISPVSCYGETDGKITVEITGSAPPFQWHWENGERGTLSRSSLKAGIYNLNVEDANACTKKVTLKVESPALLEGIEVNCEALNSGNLILTAKGGTSPYLYSVDGSPFLEENSLQNLNAGTFYDLVIEDAAGCQVEQSFLMPAFYEKMVELPAEILVKIGEQYQFDPQLNIPDNLIQSVRWIPDSLFSCSGCLRPEVRVLEGKLYTLRLIDRFGCRGEAEVQLVIDPTLDVFMPSVFSPNGDLLNDRFFVMANAIQVTLVRDFLIFDRWGGAIFEVHDVLPNDPDAGWDGLTRGQQLPNGVYVFYARLKLVDGTERMVEGDVLLIR